jgi:hypothetical protein
LLHPTQSIGQCSLSLCTFESAIHQSPLSPPHQPPSHHIRHTRSHQQDLLSRFTNPILAEAQDGCTCSSSPSQCTCTSHRSPVLLISTGEGASCRQSCSRYGKYQDQQSHFGHATCHEDEGKATCYSTSLRAQLSTILLPLTSRS